jgi:hypothetical protein
MVEKGLQISQHGRGPVVHQANTLDEVRAWYLELLF